MAGGQMIGRRQWIALFCFFLVYLVVGGLVFMYLESDFEQKSLEEREELRRAVKVFLEEVNASDSVIRNMSVLCNVDIEAPDDPDPGTTQGLKWNYYNSFFFAYTVVTTIGYGNLSPSTPIGRLFCIIYALFGVPMNTVLMVTLAENFSTKLIKQHQKSKRKVLEGKWSPWADTMVYLIPGLLVFIFVPAAVFTALEDWNFLDSVYFAFISLTTIGFGDYVAGHRQVTNDTTNWLWAYKIVLVCWIMFGLSYILMILGFIQKVLKSERLKELEKKVTKGIVTAGQKMATNIHKEMIDARKLINAVNLSKIKGSSPFVQAPVSLLMKLAGTMVVNETRNEDDPYRDVEAPVINASSTDVASLLATQICESTEAVCGGLGIDSLDEKIETLEKLNKLLSTPVTLRKGPEGLRSSKSSRSLQSLAPGGSLNPLLRVPPSRSKSVGKLSPMNDDQSTDQLPSLPESWPPPPEIRIHDDTEAEGEDDGELTTTLGNLLSAVSLVFESSAQLSVSSVEEEDDEVEEVQIHSFSRPTSRSLKPRRSVFGEETKRPRSLSARFLPRRLSSRSPDFNSIKKTFSGWKLGGSLEDVKVDSYT